MRSLLAVVILFAAFVAIPAPVSADDCLVYQPGLPSHTPLCWNRDPKVTTPTGPAVTPRNQAVAYCATFSDSEGDPMWMTFHWGGASKTSLAQTKSFTWCPSHTWTTSGPACVYASVHDSPQDTLSQLHGYHGPEVRSSCLQVIIGSAPLIPGEPTGDVDLVAGPEAHSYCATTTDPDFDPIQYVFDFGTRTFTSPTVPSGASYCASHAFLEPGGYCVRVYAQDLILPVRGWSACHTVTASA